MKEKSADRIKVDNEREKINFELIYQAIMKEAGNRVGAVQDYFVYK